MNLVKMVGHQTVLQVAFYNFVQTPVPGGARVAPNYDGFVASRTPFKAVLEHLRPDRVLVCGKRLWNGIEDRQQENRLHDRLQAYHLADDTYVWCLATVHPSSGRYSWRRLHPLITAFLEDLARTAGMLRHS